MPSDDILCDVTEGVMTITLNRPDKLNAFTPAMCSAMIAAFDRADDDDAIRVVFVTGAGRGFCAGADISEGASRFDVSRRLGSAGAARSTTRARRSGIPAAGSPCVFSRA